MNYVLNQKYIFISHRTKHLTAIYCHLILRYQVLLEAVCGSSDGAVAQRCQKDNGKLTIKRIHDQNVSVKPSITPPPNERFKDSRCFVAVVLEYNGLSFGSIL